MQGPNKVFLFIDNWMILFHRVILCCNVVSLLHVMAAWRINRRRGQITRKRRETTLEYFFTRNFLLFYCAQLLRRALHSRPNNDNYSISQLRFGVTIWPSQKKSKRKVVFTKLAASTEPNWSASKVTNQSQRRQQHLSQERVFHWRWNSDSGKKTKRINRKNSNIGEKLFFFNSCCFCFCAFHSSLVKLSNASSPFCFHSA